MPILNSPGVIAHRQFGPIMRTRPLRPASLFGQHIQRRNTFGDGDNQFDTYCVDRFQNGVFAERRRDVDNGCGRTGSFYCFAHGVEHRQTQVRGAAFARRYAADTLRTVSNRLFGVEEGPRLPVKPRQITAVSLLIKTDIISLRCGSNLLSCIRQTFRCNNIQATVSQISSRRVRRCCLSDAAPPERSRPASSTAPLIPSTSKMQRTIPPKMLTRTAFTLSSEEG